VRGALADQESAVAADDGGDYTYGRGLGQAALTQVDMIIVPGQEF
jgi:hypothetical protein